MSESIEQPVPEAEPEEDPFKLIAYALQDLETQYGLVGIAHPGHRVRLVVNEQILADEPVDENGNFYFKFAKIEDEIVSIRVEEIDAEGNLLDAYTLPEEDLLPPEEEGQTRDGVIEIGSYEDLLAHLRIATQSEMTIPKQFENAYLIIWEPGEYKLTDNILINEDQLVQELTVKFNQKPLIDYGLFYASNSEGIFTLDGQNKSIEIENGQGQTHALFSGLYSNNETRLIVQNIKVIHKNSVLGAPLATITHTRGADSTNAIFKNIEIFVKESVLPIYYRWADAGVPAFSSNSACGLVAQSGGFDYENINIQIGGDIGRNIPQTETIPSQSAVSAGLFLNFRGIAQSFDKETPIFHKIRELIKNENISQVIEELKKSYPGGKDAVASNINLSVGGSIIASGNYNSTAVGIALHGYGILDTIKINIGQNIEAVFTHQGDDKDKKGDIVVLSPTLYDSFVLCNSDVHVAGQMIQRSSSDQYEYEFLSNTITIFPYYCLRNSIRIVANNNISVGGVTSDITSNFKSFSGYGSGNASEPDPVKLHSIYKNNYYLGDVKLLNLRKIKNEPRPINFFPGFQQLKFINHINTEACIKYNTVNIGNINLNAYQDIYGALLVNQQSALEISDMSIKTGNLDITSQEGDIDFSCGATFAFDPIKNTSIYTGDIKILSPGSQDIKFGGLAEYAGYKNYSKAIFENIDLNIGSVYILGGQSITDYTIYASLGAAMSRQPRANERNDFRGVRILCRGDFTVGGGSQALVGGFAGSGNSMNTENCSIQILGSMNVSSYKPYVGGFTGYSAGSTFDRCTSLILKDINIDGYYADGGGFAGRIKDSSVINSSSHVAQGVNISAKEIKNGGAFGSLLNTDLRGFTYFLNDKLGLDETSLAGEADFSAGFDKVYLNMVNDDEKILPHDVSPTNENKTEYKPSRSLYKLKSTGTSVVKETDEPSFAAYIIKRPFQNQFWGANVASINPENDTFDYVLKYVPYADFNKDRSADLNHFSSEGANGPVPDAGYKHLTVSGAQNNRHLALYITNDDPGSRSIGDNVTIDILGIPAGYAVSDPPEPDQPTSPTTTQSESQPEPQPEPQPSYLPVESGGPTAYTPIPGTVVQPTVEGSKLDGTLHAVTPIPRSGENGMIYLIPFMLLTLAGALVLMVKKLR